METVKFSPDGGATRSQAAPDVVEQMVEIRTRERVGEIQLSRAKARLQARRAAGKRPAITKVEDGEDVWFVRTLSLPLMREITMRAARDENGVLSIDGEEEYSQFVAAILFVSLVTSETDLSPYFDRSPQGWKEASQQADEPEFANSNGMIVNTCLVLNPDIFPEATNELNRMMDEKARLLESIEEDYGPLDLAPESSTSRIESLENGLPDNPPMPLLSTSATDSLPLTAAPENTPSEAIG